MTSTFTMSRCDNPCNSVNSGFAPKMQPAVTRLRLNNEIGFATPLSLHTPQRTFDGSCSANAYHDHQLSWFELYNKPLQSTKLTGHFAGAIALLWYNSWEKLQLVFEGKANISCLSLHLPDYFMRYVQHVVETAMLSEHLLNVALIYIGRLRKNSTCAAGVYTSEARILVAALMAADKYEDDVSVSTSTWARLGNIDIHELKKMEIEFLTKLNFNLHIKPHEWEQHSAFIERSLFPLVDQLAAS